MFPGKSPLRSRGFTLGALLIAAAAWFAQPALAQERGKDRSKADAEQTPAALYHNYCSVCHGDKGDGQSRAQGSMKPAPRDFTTPQATQELTRERMLAAVRTGVPGTAMTGWRSQLSDDQIVKVVDYVRSSFMAPSITDDSNRGRQIYARVCSVCHGDRGNGSMWASANLRPTPRDFTSPEARADLTRERMLQAVAGGRPNTAMPGYSTRLSFEDRVAVVDYIRTSIMRIDADKGISGTHARGVPADMKPRQPYQPGETAKPAEQKPVEVARAAPVAKPDSHAGHNHAKADMAAPMPNNLKADVAAGKKFYDNNCATCHGVKGDGQGPRAYFIMPKPAVFNNAAARSSMNRAFIYEATSNGRRGTEMPAWDKVLTPQEIANVSEYVFRAFIQTGKDDVAKKK
jgi:mono/diheme cytochrome c family protein